MSWQTTSRQDILNNKCALHSRGECSGKVTTIVVTPVTSVYVGVCSLHAALNRFWEVDLKQLLADVWDEAKNSSYSTNPWE